MSEIKTMMMNGIARMLKNIGGNPGKVIGTRTNVTPIKTPSLLIENIDKNAKIDDNFVKQAEEAFATIVGNKNASEEQIDILYDNLEFANNMKNPPVYIANQEMDNLMKDAYYQLESAKSAVMNDKLDDARGILRYEVGENYKYPSAVREAAEDARYMIRRGEGIDWREQGYESMDEAKEALLNKINEAQNKTSKDFWPDYTQPFEGEGKQIEYYDFYTDLPEDTRNPAADFTDIKNLFGEFANGGRVGFQAGGNLLSRYMENLAASEAAAYAPTSPVFMNPTVMNVSQSSGDSETQNLGLEAPTNTVSQQISNMMSNARTGNVSFAGSLLGNTLGNAIAPGIGGLLGGFIGGYGGNVGGLGGNVSTPGAEDDPGPNAGAGGSAGAAAASAAGSNDGPGGGTFAKGGRVGFESGGFGSAKDFIESTGESELMDIYIKVMDGTLPEDALIKALENRGYKTYATGGRVQAAGGGIMSTREAFKIGGSKSFRDMLAKFLGQQIKSKEINAQGVSEIFDALDQAKKAGIPINSMKDLENFMQNVGDVRSKVYESRRIYPGVGGEKSGLPVSDKDLVPKTNLKKVRAQKKADEEGIKSLAESKQIPVKQGEVMEDGTPDYEYYRELLDNDEYDVVQGNETVEQLEAMLKEQDDYKKYMYGQYKAGKLGSKIGDDISKISDTEIAKAYREAREGNDLDLSDDKYDAQILSEYLSDNLYKTEFSDLPQDAQLDLYDRAYSFLMEDKMEKAMQKAKPMKGPIDMKTGKNIMTGQKVMDVDYIPGEEPLTPEVKKVPRKDNAKGGLNYLMGF